MPFLNILIWILGVLFIALYLFFQIRKYLKWKKIYNKNLKKGITIEQAKEIANMIVYRKKKRKTKKNVENNDIIYEE